MCILCRLFHGMFVHTPTGICREHSCAFILKTIFLLKRVYAAWMRELGGGMKNRKTNENRLAVLPSCKMTQTAEGNREREASSKAVDRQSKEKSILKINQSLLARKHLKHDEESG